MLYFESSFTPDGALQLIRKRRKPYKTLFQLPTVTELYTRIPITPEWGCRKLGHVFPLVEHYVWWVVSPQMEHECWGMMHDVPREKAVSADLSCCTRWLLRTLTSCFPCSGRLSTLSIHCSGMYLQQPIQLRKLHDKPGVTCTEKGVLFKLLKENSAPVFPRCLAGETEIVWHVLRKELIY